jgi:glycine reductase
VRAELVRPGDPVRIVNVLDAVEPQVKDDDPDATFPGALGTLVVAGRGRTNRLDGVAVISAADLLPSTDAAARDIQDGVIDMSGGGAAYTPWARTTNLVLTFERDPSAPLIEVDAAIRRSALRVARDFAATTVGARADALERTVGPAGDPPPVRRPGLAGNRSYDTFFTARRSAPLTDAGRPHRMLMGDHAGPTTGPRLHPTYCYQRSRLSGCQRRTARGPISGG